ncbi:hypothetical protein Lal_00023895 [Lupinus albus]|nr:hypothetical protein Lal_00023895 [Lupinus albus]
MSRCESDGVHVCNKCGWSYPNPHPSAKHRRAHKKICGTIEGYKICVSDEQTHFYCSDDEHVYDVDHKTPGWVVSAPNNLDKSKTEKVRLRSEDEVFSDAFAHFSDSGLSPRTMELLEQDSLDSGTSAEQVGIEDPEFSGVLRRTLIAEAVQVTATGSRLEACYHHLGYLVGEFHSFAASELLFSEKLQFF